ncbi:hypothetical protein KAFR_0C01450 [Kazachstania africana CBS 2517]|uniref:Uncharacterized protein n=1 Tax=Kazachstania africana (strain ATCC 22294 / BCRC 22015 / CBS 2517 / CECT 1963 / NBRC 1671 / NRRL Y-8276) TaxID=1071382 RepID=H2ARY8_KAZAF|nr:hypothetical protein KAFR_0C01450 [Kazachstania africana CBS 2517]CCF57138.1 hypothetical protein KAFR_0C01450 [Kazachstania africana CBS 2517]
MSKTEVTLIGYAVDVLREYSCMYKFSYNIIGNRILLQDKDIGTYLSYKKLLTSIKNVYSSNTSSIESLLSADNDDISTLNDDVGKTYSNNHSLLTSLFMKKMLPVTFDTFVLDHLIEMCTVENHPYFEGQFSSIRKPRLIEKICQRFRDKLYSLRSTYHYDEATTLSANTSSTVFSTRYRRREETPMTTFGSTNVFNLFDDAHGCRGDQ